MRLTLFNSKNYHPDVEFIEQPVAGVALSLEGEQENRHSFETLDISKPEFSQDNMKTSCFETPSESEKAALLPTEKKAGSKQSLDLVSSHRSIAKSVALVALGLFTLYVGVACLKGSFNPLDWVTRLQYWSDSGRSYKVCVRTAPTWPWNNSPNDAYCQRSKIKILSGPPLVLHHYNQGGCKLESPKNETVLGNWLHSSQCVEQFLNLEKKFGDRLTPLSLFCSVNGAHEICAKKFHKE